VSVSVCWSQLNGLMMSEDGGLERDGVFPGNWKFFGNWVFSFSFFFSSQEWSPSHLEWDLELSDVVTVGILRRFGGLTWPFSSFFLLFSEY